MTVPAQTLRPLPYDTDIASAAAITTRLFDLGWIERGPRRRSVRVTPAGIEGLACTFGAELP